jgi:uncharacterized protein (TIGR02246 family)
MDRKGSAAKRGPGHRLRVAVLVVLGELAGCAGTRERAVPSHVREIEARNRDLERQFREGNLLGVADAYADDAVLIDARGRRTSGREEIDAYWSSIESPVEWRLEIRGVRGSDAIAYEIGTSRLTTRRDAGLHTAVTDFLLLWQREPDGEWRIQLDAYWPRDER